MEEEDVFIPAKDVIKTYKITSATLLSWAKAGKVEYIQSEGGRHLYSRNGIHKMFGRKKKLIEKKGLIYGRVSSNKQKDDLTRQIKDLQDKYPDYEVIKDIGSGINWNKKGLQTLLDRVLQCTISEVVISHRDRLCRIGFELLEYIFKKCGTRIVVLFESEGSEEQELQEDLLSIVTIFFARHNGKRASDNRKRRRMELQENQVTSNQETNRDSE
jgi:putative resolvase